MNTKSLSESSLTEGPVVKDESNKKAGTGNEVQPFYNRDVWFVTTNAAKTKIEARLKQLEKVSTEILTNSDVAHEEKEANKYLCEVLRKMGCDIHYHYIHPTAFKAVYKSKPLTDTSNIPTVGLICEYDAVKDFGHSSGNNLLTEATIATVLGVREAMKSDTRLIGQLIIFGTPASEESGGKIRMMKEGAFDNLDVIVAINPSHYNCLFPKFYCSQKIKICFYGKSRHIDCSNLFHSQNAVDAAVLCYMNTMILSNQLKPNARLHCLIKKSGDVDYLVPKKSELIVCIKAEQLEDLDDIGRRVVDCGESAANTTNTKVDITFLDDDMYCYLNHNKVLANVFKEEAKAQGIDFKDEVNTKPIIYRSTDLGNVSHKVPLIYPSFSIGTTDVPLVHTREFANAITRAEAQTNTVKASIALTFTVIKYLLNPSLQNEIRQQFETDVNDIKTKLNQNQK